MESYIQAALTLHINLVKHELRLQLIFYGIRV